MQVIEVVPCGPLAGKFPSMKIAAATGADAIEGWSRQVSSGVINTVMEAIDFETEKKLKAPTKVERIELWPAMFGGGGKFGQILIGAAMIGISFIPGIGTAIAASLLIAGITNVAMGVLGLFMKAPSISKEEDPEASKYLGSGRNTTAIGTLIGIGGGRMMAGGQLLSLQVNSTDLVYGKFPTTPT